MKQAFSSASLFVASLLIYGCGSGNPPTDLEANRNVVRKFHDVWSNGKVAALDSIVAPDFVCHFIDGMEWKGIDGASHSITSHRQAFPDWNEEIVDMISEGDKVVTRYKSTGTQNGPFIGQDSTGRKVTIYETSIYRVENGKIAEQWGFPDAMSLNNQVQGKK